MTEVYQVIAQVGFPAAVAAFLIWHLPKQIDRLAEKLERNTRAVMALTVALCMSHGLDPNDVQRLAGNGLER